MKISIAMATYNGAPYLKEQLNSFIVQTRQPDELIVCDDGSTDETVEILDAFAAQAPFDVHIQRNPENIGYSQNFSKALSLCSGDLIFLSDQDDVWFPTKIATMADIAEDDVSNQVFMNDAELTYEDLRPTGLTKLGQIRAAGIVERSFVMGCCAAIKGGFLKDVLPIPVGYRGNDTWIVNIAEGLGKRRIVEKTLQFYRRHGGNESATIVNSTTKINKITYFWHQIVSRVNKGSLKTLEQSSKEIEHLISRLEQMLARGDSRYDANNEIIIYLRDVACMREATKMRLAILKKTRVGRFVPVVKMLIHGQYNYFYGVKGAFADVFFE